MKNIKLYIIGALAICVTSCSKWLDVKPEDKFIEEEVYKSKQGFADGLNGIYLKLGASNMYGSQLTMETVDILAKYYNISSIHSVERRNLVEYAYAQDDAKNKIDNIWTNFYLNILNINKFIENVDQYGNAVLDKEEHNVMRGEGLALRAYLYFDLLRLFAPAYHVDNESKLIPYYGKSSYEFAEFSTSKYIAERILEDLNTAEQLLAVSDPVINMVVVDRTMGSVDLGTKPYMVFRNYHMNYFAVKGLQARVNLYLGNKAEALKAAETVIAAKSKFPWLSTTSSPFTDNKIFSTEILFAFENPKRTSIYDNLFNPSQDDKSILAAGSNSNYLNKVFENWENDYRYANQWIQSGGKTYRTFQKYKAPTYGNYQNTIAGLRLSEVFLIAAECTNDQDKAIEYLNEIRRHRNCDVLGSGANISLSIALEYRKEFYGEGQLWYFYKRTNASSILSATTANEVNINENDYTFPIPLSELDPR